MQLCLFFVKNRVNRQKRKFIELKVSQKNRATFKNQLIDAPVHPLGFSPNKQQVPPVKKNTIK